MKDPTIEDMRAFLSANAAYLEASEFDVEEAIYWFAYEWHGGQSSNLYSALCQSQFSPGPCSSGPEPGSVAETLVEYLTDEYGVQS